MRLAGICGVFGVFLLVGTNAAGDVTFTSKPLVIEAKDGEKVVLPCEFHANKPYIRLWVKENTVLYVGTQPIYQSNYCSLGKDNSSLEVTVKAGVKETVGEIECQVNSGDKPKLVHRIILLGPPKMIRHPESGVIQVKEGEPLEFGCTSDSAPAPKVTYTHDGGLDVTPLLVDGMIRVAAAERKHSGKYVCTGDNGYEPKDSQTIEIKVLGKPDVKVSLDWNTSSHIKSVEITCKVGSDVPANVHWLKGAGKVLNSNTIQTSQGPPDTYKLRISPAEKAAFGNYTCSASNQFGNATGTIEVSSQPIKPEVSIVPGVVDATISLATVSPFPVTKFILKYRPRGGQTKTIEVPVEGNMVADVGKSIATTKLDGLKSDQDYEGSVVAENDRSGVSSETAISFKTKPASSTSSSTQLVASLMSVIVATAVLVRA